MVSDSNSALEVRPKTRNLASELRHSGLQISPSKILSGPLIFYVILDRLLQLSNLILFRAYLVPYPFALFTRKHAKHSTLIPA